MSYSGTNVGFDREMQGGLFTLHCRRDRSGGGASRSTGGPSRSGRRGRGQRKGAGGWRAGKGGTPAGELLDMIRK